MKTLLLLFCYLLFISKSPVLGQVCSIEGITSTIAIIPLDDTQVNTNLLTGKYEDESLEVGTCTSEDSFGTSYFSVTANGTYFLIDTIDEFANFDKNTPKTTSSVQTVTLVCPLTCTSSVILTIQFQVTDTNNHKPEFSKTSYELKVPSPVMPLTDISVYGDLVLATDIDFSNQDVTFTIEPDDFSITTLSTSTSKDYTAVFSTRSILQLTGTQEYTITAVDSGTPTQSETVTLTITVDEEQSLDTPSFEQALYSFNYSVTNEVPSLTPNDGSITLITIKPNSVSEPTLSGIFSAYSGYFTAEFDASTSTIDFQVTDSIPTTSASILVFTLSVTTDNTASTSIIVYLSADSTGAPQFSNHYYTGTYNDVTDQVEHDVITITSGGTPVVTISGGGTYSDHFQIEKEDDGSYKVTVKTELPSEALTENNLILTLEAALDDATSYATLVINLPSTTEGNSIEFSEALYSASYEIVDGEGVFTINGTINVETEEDDTNVKPSISNSDGYDTYFEISYSSNVVTVTATDIPTEVLAKNSFIPLVLTVGIEGTSAESSAVLNVEINYEQSETSIAFSNILYSGTYEVVDGIGTLQITDTISIDTEKIDDNINIVITNEYADFFNVELSENEVKITLEKQLTETIVNSSSVVPLALRAGIAGTSVIAEAVVNIAIIYESDEDDPESIEFGSVLYTAEYSVSDGKASLILDQSIKVISTSSDIEPTISADSVYGEYFDVSYNNNEVLVELKENLPDEVVQSNTFITLTLEVGIKDTVHRSSAVLNIIIESGSNNDQGSIAFSSLLYNAKYEIIDNSPNLTYGAITISTDPSDSNVEVKITNEYDSYFSVTYIDKVVYIKIEKELTEEIVASLSVVPLILQAQIEGTTYRASAVVNIAIIYDSDGDTDFVQFTSVLYNGEYTIEDGKSSLTIDDSIKIVSSREDSDIIVYISEDSLYRDYFLATYVERIVTVTLTKSLPSAAVKSNFVALTLNVGILNTIHNSSAVLNIGINNADDNSDSNVNDDEDSKTELHHLRITFIVVTAILSVLLLACIAGALAYYFLKIRSDNYANLEEDGSGRVRFGKNSLSRSPSSK